MKEAGNNFARYLNKPDADTQTYITIFSKKKKKEQKEEEEEV